MVLDRLVAVVNGDVILESDVDEERRFEEVQPYRTVATYTRERIIERLIDRALVLQQAAAMTDDAIIVTDFIRLKQERFIPDRDIILALTADEEGGTSNGVEWLLKNHRDLIDADFVLNSDGGGVTTNQGKVENISVDATEKVYADYQLTVTNAGGHSSIPVPDNAIYHLAGALTRLEHYEFPFALNSVTRAYYERMSTVETGQRAADFKAILKTPPDPAASARLSQDRAGRRQERVVPNGA